MADQVTALTAFPGDSGLIPTIPMWFIVPGNLTFSSGPYRHCTNVVYRHVCNQNILNGRIAKYGMFSKNKKILVPTMLYT